MADLIGDALAHHRAGRLAEAEAIYRRILAADPNHVEALRLLGMIALQVGRHADAIRLLERALRLKPDHAELGATLADAHFALGQAAERRGGFDEAAEHYRRVTQLQPLMAEGHFNLGAALSAGADATEIIPHIAQAARLRPDLSVAHQKLLHLYHFVPDADAKANFERHREWARQFADPLSSGAAPHANDRDPHRRLRIGYISPDFRRHSVAYFLEPLLASHDRDQVEIFCYADEIKRDVTTARLQSLANHWRAISGWSDERVAQLIRADAIDILVDLAGHLAHSRLLAFARKPAPIQATYLGYPDTTGLSAIEYRLTDALADPPGQGDAFYTEKLIRLPRCAWCYRPDDASPPAERDPADGRITFGSFNAAMKINAPLIAVWARILRAVPGSRMIIKDGQGTPSPAHPRLRREFERHGISADRVELLSFVPDVSEHLRLYRRVDVALDTFPYHGTTTTCEAMWMGVPVVTLAGDRHVSRVGVSLMDQVGLADLVARSGEEYLRLAASLAADVARRAQLRQDLRQRMQRSPLMDGPRFARDVDAAYRQMWHGWCRAASP